MRNIEIVRKELFDFLDLKNVKKIAIITDNDEDGLTSALNGKLFFEKNCMKVQVFFYDHSNRNSENFVKPFTDFNPDKTIFFDLNENFVFDIIKDIDIVLKDFVVIDHHQGIELVNIQQKYLVIKPKDFSKIEPSKYPASKMVFDLFGGKEWFAAIGIIGDSSTEQWADFIEKVCKNISKKKLFEIADVCSCIVSMHEKKISLLFDFLYNAEKPIDLLKSSFAELNNDFQNILKSELNRAKKEGEFVEKIDLIFFETKPRLPSKLSNLFSSKHKNKTIIFYSIENNFVKCSFRRQDFKVNCNVLANISLNGFENASGGGHIPASAARFPKKYLLEFKQNVISYLEKNYVTKKV